MKKRNRYVWKITEELYKRIHVRAEQGGLTNNELGALFGVSEDTARRCAKAGTYAEYKELVNNKTKNAQEIKAEEKHEQIEANCREFVEVLCVETGEGFIRGKTYPMLGWNNGVHVLRETENGDIYEKVCCCGGIGKGEINNYDNTGKPSFTAFRQGSVFQATTEEVLRAIQYVLEDLAGYVSCQWKE